jgi:thiol-disulfide isomerase/thioredoxin
MYLELEQDNLAEIIEQNPMVMVQYSAGWCGNCRIIKPKFKKLAEENPEVTFVMVDAENFVESRKLADVSNLPTFAGFKNGSLSNQIQTNKTEILIDFFNEITNN